MEDFTRQIQLINSWENKHPILKSNLVLNLKNKIAKSKVRQAEQINYAWIFNRLQNIKCLTTNWRHQKFNQWEIRSINDIQTQMTNTR